MTENLQNYKSEQVAGERVIDIATDKSCNNADCATICKQLSESEKIFCKEAEERIVEILSDCGLAGTVMGRSIINLSGGINAGKIKVARLKMNRIPKVKAINALKDSMIEVGQQTMLLVIPAVVANALRFEIESFDGDTIPEDELKITVVVIDGQTRMLAYLQANEDATGVEIPDLYAYFPLNWVSLSEMLKSINLKVFTWKNSDYMTGVLSHGKIAEDTQKELKYIQELESKGYNYTTACNWATLEKGIIRKAPLVKSMSSSNSSLKFDNAKYGIELCEVTRKKFSGDNETVLKMKTFPELVISKWHESCKELNYVQATEYLKAFFNSLSDEEVIKIANPSGYKRGCGKKKEEFVVEHFNEAFNNFHRKHPLSEFKSV